MAQQTNSNIALCPECDGPVHLSGKLKVGRKLSCRRCGATLVIAERKPLELVPANNSHALNTPPKATNKKRAEENRTANEQIADLQEIPQMAPPSSVRLADCPECSAALRFHNRLREGQLVVCPECDETLEVMSLKPLELTWANDDPWEYGAKDNAQQYSRQGSR